MGGPGSGPKKRRYVMGRLGVVLETDIPTRVIGVAQRAEAVIPSTCPKCHSGPPNWATTAWQGHCRCGCTWYRTVGEVRFRAHRQKTPVYYA